MTLPRRICCLVRLAALAVAAALALPATAALLGTEHPAAIRAVAERFLQTENAGVPGRLAIEVKPPRAALPKCSALEAFQNPGTRPAGNTNVGVRCLAPMKWTVYLPARVQIAGPYAVLREAVPAHHVLSAADLQLREGDLGALPPDAVVDPTAIVGYRTVSALAAGAPLRQGVLRAPLAVQQGQTTRLILNGPGFSVSSEGQALANAGRGEAVRVKTRSGLVVSGVAQEGQQVQVAF